MNPVIVTKCQPTDDFFEAYCIYYDFGRNKIVSGVTRDSLNQVGLSANSSTKLNTWYHVVITYDNDWFSFYIDGKKENKIKKGFVTKFLQGDSLMIGNSANTKNKRFFNGAVDDVVLFNKVLSEKEVEELYEAPNPNKYIIIRNWVFLFSGILLLIIGTVIFFVKRYKKGFEKEMEKNRLQNKVFELEIKAMKAQMNPHFIFNSLNSIQQFVLEKDDDNAYKYLSKFSVLMRKILETNNKESINLEDEIKILEGYLEIESLRFSNAFEWEIFVDITVNTAKINIPHMMIQPFIENAIWHGLLHKKGDKKLVVKFLPLNDKVIKCIIEDNGAGRNAEKKEDITGKKSLAIDFIKQRLELLGKMNNADCTLQLIDKKDNNGNNSGTIVEITLPVLN